MHHIVGSEEFDTKFIERIFSIADRLKKKTDTPLRGKILASLFYEPSTRTRFSFESAMLRLGGSVISTENAREFSSASKGEILEDSIKVINNYADVIVMRHYEAGAAKRAASVSKIPLINAGDGPGQHPTQALLDLYTIKKELGKIDGIRIALVGDLKNSRTIRSLSYLLGKYKNIKIYFVSPKSLQINNEIKTYLKKHKVVFEEMENTKSIISSIDVLYQTRIQKERFKNQKEYLRLRDFYRVDMHLVTQMKKEAIIMDPLPRVHTIATEVDASPKAMYFKQVHYGLLIRMALLKYLLT
ncbi:MAG: aspartate carbamoyltransferase [Candidatus Pacebacteria bacterium]|nr:aspartate carbamoyltransferase [Candidatus Paceibacterota bacterium]MDD5356856.1 aspartate carbamoyltransferase [Candidatus Paceibacterota bacterium]